MSIFNDESHIYALKWWNETKNYSNQLINELEKCILETDLKKYTKHLYRMYNIYYSNGQLWEKIKKLFGDEYSKLFTHYQERVLANTFINDIVFKYYPNEIFVKYNLIKDWISKNNDTVLFEFNSGGSRVDLCRINGNSYAYEIKTEFDDFSRLDKQINDYAKIFEYVYVVTTKNRWDSISQKIPDFCGVILYQVSKNGEFKKWTKKKSQKSPYLSSMDQIGVMTSDDIRFILRKKGLNVPLIRKERESLLINNFKANSINKLFKEVLKKKYQSQWNDTRTNFESILPIDIQSYFHNPLDLDLVYYKDWSTVNI
jgi:hypothetical protein